MMTIILTMAALLGTPQAVAAPPTALDVDLPELANATADPTCGGNAGLAQQAFCVATTQAGVVDVVDAYNAAFEREGWLAADGRENLTVYIKRRPQGGCDAFQMLAFAPDQAVAPAAPAYLALAKIPGDICSAQTPTPQTPGADIPAPQGPPAQ